MLIEQGTSGSNLNDLFAEAGAAVQLPEVKAMIEKLASYNLGVYSLHMHDKNGETVPLPEDVIVMEKDQKISFAQGDQCASGESRQMAAAVGWRYHSGAVQVFSRCNSSGCGD